MTKIAILGGGSWGTALAILLSRSRISHEISLWVHDPVLAKTMQRSRENPTYLPGYALPSLVRVTHDMADVLTGAEIALGAIPSTYAREVYVQAIPLLGEGATIISTTKGLEPSTHLRMSEMISQIAGQRRAANLAVLSGPSFALEAARGDPTAVVLSSIKKDLLEELQEELGGPTFRLYVNTDVLGVELGGAAKNVIAIAAGVCQGLGLGSNTVAALITRGLAEMTRIGVRLGAYAETLSGLAGLGDLVLTCTGNLSRNRTVGTGLGKGRKLSEILAGMRMVAEGVGTAPALLALAHQAGVELPITQQVNAILHESKSPRDAIRDIMERPQKRE